MEQKSHTRSSRFRVLVFGIMVVLAIILIGLNTVGRKHDTAPSNLRSTGVPQTVHLDSTHVRKPYQSETLQSNQDEITTSRRNAIVRAVEKVEPAVVSITVTQIIRTRLFPSIFDDPFLRHFFPEFRREYQRKVYGIGSGFIISEDGYVLTNEHVISSAQEIVVTLTDGTQSKGKVVGSDSRLDVALLKIDERNLPYVTLGCSDDLIIGEWAIAIGNPFGFVLDKSKPTVTIGVVSAFHRDFESHPGERVYKDMIQTDAAINQGNSGGPLVNSNGEVIGINTFIFTGGQYSEGSIGIGFAIPINRAKKVADELLQYGRIRDFWTGISIQNIDWLIAQSLDLQSTNGAIISQIESDSPGELAGLQIGDIILKVNTKIVQDTDDVIDAFAEGQVGDIYNLTIQRRGKEMSIPLKLEEVTP
ncbi:MAG: trypsin-like peptidase domain-containing protein [Gemmatimonadota bacterium]|nr:MAG: trypsin-like peptidase domain-containing protein [Gemmatimonadota bacterium]